jgi:hypothetical protein
MSKLEAVVYRNRYLESQVSERQKDIESQRERSRSNCLLTASRSQAGWLISAFVLSAQNNGASIL